MAGVLDFIFGSGPLKKAADGPKPDTKPQGNQDAGLDIGKMAQDQADKQKAQPAPKKGLSTPMTPQTPNGGTKGK
jgi:hypothetical protein